MLLSPSSCGACCHPYYSLPRNLYPMSVSSPCLHLVLLCPTFTPHPKSQHIHQSPWHPSPCSPSPNTPHLYLLPTHPPHKYLTIPYATRAARIFLPHSPLVTIPTSLPPSYLNLDPAPPTSIPHLITIPPAASNPHNLLLWQSLHICCPWQLLPTPPHICWLGNSYHSPSHSLVNNPWYILPYHAPLYLMMNIS